MRVCWRKEANLRQRQNSVEADKEKERGNKVFQVLAFGNEALLAKYARGYFDGDEDLVEDGVQELVVALYRELRNLSDNTHAMLWESRFGYCLKALAHTQFIRRLQKHYGKSKPEKDPEEPGKERPYYEQRQSDLMADSDDFDPIASAPDPDSLETIPNLLDREGLAAILAAIPDSAQREALRLWSSGWKQDRIAEHLGCSVKTVYNRIEKALEAARAWARERYQTHGEFSDWIES